MIAFYSIIQFSSVIVMILAFLIIIIIICIS